MGIVTHTRLDSNWNPANIPTNYSLGLMYIYILKFPPSEYIPVPVQSVTALRVVTGICFPSGGFSSGKGIPLPIVCDTLKWKRYSIAEAILQIPGGVPALDIVAILVRFWLACRAFTVSPLRLNCL